MKQIRGKYLMVLVAMCGMIASSLGMLTNVSGLFFSPVAEELGLGRGSVSMTLTISNLIFALGGMLSAKLVRSKNFKLVLMIGTAAFALGTAGLALSSDLVLLYGLNAIRGFAAGVVGNVLVTTVINQWFHVQTGLVTSVAMGCSGLTGALLSPVLSAVIEGAGWRTGYLTAAILIALLNLPAILLPISFRPEDVGLEPLGGGGTAQEATMNAGGTVSVTLLILALIYAVFGAFVTALPQHFPGLAGSFGFSVAVGSGMLSVCMVANTAGKLVFGALADRLGAKRTILACGCLISLAAVLMLLIHHAGTMFVTAALFGLGYSLPTVGAVLVTKDLFGLERYSKVYPKINLGTTVANAAGTSLIGFLYDASGNYLGALWLTLGVVLLLMAAVIIAYRRRA